MNHEEWRPITQYGNSYEVSNRGRVRVIATGQIKATTLNRKYPSVTLYASGRFRESIHRLVAREFIGPRPPGMEVRHLDGDPTNNCPENLIYGTHTENMADKRLHGTSRNAHTGKTHCKRGHEFTAENTTHYVTQGIAKRGCKECARERQANRPRRVAAER